MKIKFLLLFISVMFFISCGGGDSGLKGELDDVKDELEQYKGEYDDLTGFVNTVDDDLSNIIKTQGELDNSIIDGGEISGSQMDRITGNIQKLERALNNANQNVANLEKKLQSANSANRTLRKSIANYKKQLAGKEKEIKEYKAKIEALKKEVADGKASIAAQKKELELKNQALESKTKELAVANEDLKKKKAELEKKNRRIVELSIGYFEYGTAKELHDKGILKDKRLTKKDKRQELEGDFHQKVSKSNKLDTSTATEIAPPGLDKEIAKVLPFRDESSYTIQEGKIVITNKAKFWDRTKVAILVTEKK